MATRPLLHMSCLPCTRTRTRTPNCAYRRVRSVVHDGWHLKSHVRDTHVRCQAGCSEQPWRPYVEVHACRHCLHHRCDQPKRNHIMAGSRARHAHIKSADYCRNAVGTRTGVSRDPDTVRALPLYPTHFCLPALWHLHKLFGRG